MASRRVLPTVAVVMLLLWILSCYVAIGPNRTGSLPIGEYPIIIVLKDGQVPTRGELVGFRPGPNRFYPADSLFVKRLVGLPGDRVTYEGSTFFINGVPAATTKPTAKDGRILTPGPVGILPACHYFVATDHPDGYDSRYSDIGWVGCSQIVGRAYALP
ncbi:MAG: S26 family signal peptidase [Candidatus Thiodiazotropha sp.]